MCVSIGIHKWQRYLPKTIVLGKVMYIVDTSSYSRKLCVLCTMKPILLIVQRTGTACFHVDCVHRDGVPVQTVRKSRFNFTISVAIVVLLLSSFFECCHSLYVDSWSDVILTAKYFSVLIATLFESLNIMGMLFQTDKFIKVMIMWLEMINRTERYGFERIFGEEMHAKMNFWFYVVGTYVVVAVLLFVPVEIVFMEGIDWPALHYLSVLLSYGCITCFTYFSTLLLVCPWTIVEKFCDQFVQFLNEIRRTGPATRNVSEHLTNVTHVFDMFRRCIRATSHFYNPTIFILSVGSTLVLILHLFVFVASRDDTALKAVCLIFTLEVVNLVVCSYICVEKLEEMVGGKRGCLFRCRNQTVISLPCM